MTDPAADDLRSQADDSTLRPGDEKWPVGFILTIVMVGGYLAYRLVQGVVLFFQWVF